MFFSIILSIFVSLILLFVMIRFGFNMAAANDPMTARIIMFAFMSVIFFIVSSLISEIVFEPMFNLQTYCNSEPDKVIELISVSERRLESPLKQGYVGVSNSLNAGEKFVVTDGEFYYYYCLDDYGIKTIKKVKVSDEIQINESKSPYAGAGVMKVYSYRYNWWGKFFFNNPDKTERLIFLIPAGTLGKGKIIFPDPVPVCVLTG